MLLLLLSILSITSATSYRFLAYNPQFANSHVNFIGKLTDALVDAGHDVVVLSTKFDTSVGGPGTNKATVIEMPQSKAARDFQEYTNAVGTTAWESESLSNLFQRLRLMSEAMNEQCSETFNHPGLLQRLRAEKFEAAYAEVLDVCGIALFHALGIERVALTNSFSAFDGGYEMTHVPTFLSYMPTMMSGHYGEDMSFTQRIENVIRHYAIKLTYHRASRSFQSAFERFYPGAPNINDVLGNVSLVFHNSEPLTDFPHLSSQKSINIGGITVTSAHKPLNRTWSEIMDLRPKTVLLSFGTFVNAYSMPEEFKQTIRETAKHFSDVTFIWKYEKPEDGVSRGIPNLIESTWVPQKDMLYDGRLTAFVTHCGQGSTLEANSAGMPLVVIPIESDQLRNAQTVKRNVLGVVLDKNSLYSPGPLANALKGVLRAMVTFVRNMEFLAEHGPLRQLDHYGARLNFFQLYLLDIFTVFLAFFTILAAVVVITVRRIFKPARIEKEKSE